MKIRIFTLTTLLSLSFSGFSLPLTCPDPDFLNTTPRVAIPPGIQVNFKGLVFSYPLEDIDKNFDSFSGVGILRSFFTFGHSQISCSYMTSPPGLNPVVVLMGQEITSNVTTVGKWITDSFGNNTCTGSVVESCMFNLGGPLTLNGMKSYS
jgi:hypothetical protein